MRPLRTRPLSLVPPAKVRLLAGAAVLISLGASPKATALDWPSGTTGHQTTIPHILTPVPCTTTATALCNVASRIAQRWNDTRDPIAPETWIVAQPTRGVPSSAVARAMSLRLAAAVASHSGRALDSTAPCSEAATWTTTARDVVCMAPALEKGRFVVRVKWMSATRQLWERARGNRVSQRMSMQVSAPIDLSVARFLPPRHLPGRVVKSWRLAGEHALAMSCSTAQDGGTIVTLMSRRFLTRWRVDSTKPRLLRRIAWNRLAPIAPTPWRAPLGSVVPLPDGSLEAGSTDRAWAVRLDSSWSRHQKLLGFPLPWAGRSVCAKTGARALEVPLQWCTPKSISRRPQPSTYWPKEMPKRFDAFFSYRLLGRDGSEETILAVRRAMQPRMLHLWNSSGLHATVDHVGAQLALADLDLDGTVELITSAPVSSPREDALVVRSWGSSGSLRLRYRLPVPKGVDAIAVCDPDETVTRAILVATGGKVWLVH